MSLYRIARSTPYETFYITVLDTGNFVLVREGEEATINNSYELIEKIRDEYVAFVENHVPLFCDVYIEVKSSGGWVDCKIQNIIRTLENI